MGRGTGAGPSGSSAGRGGRGSGRGAPSAGKQGRGMGGRSAAARTGRGGESESFRRAAQKTKLSTVQFDDAIAKAKAAQVAATTAAAKAKAASDLAKAKAAKAAATRKSSAASAAATRSASVAKTSTQGQSPRGGAKSGKRAGTGQGASSAGNQGQSRRGGAKGGYRAGPGQAPGSRGSGSRGGRKGGQGSRGGRGRGGNGGGAGGAGGGSGGCFVEGTAIQMADGTTKEITTIQIGEETKGGTVQAKMEFMPQNIYEYKGVLVSGSHWVVEDNQFIEVQDSKHGVLTDRVEPVHTFKTSENRIWIHGIEFGDFETGSDEDWAPYFEEVKQKLNKELLVNSENI